MNTPMELAMLAIWIPELPFQLASQRDASLRGRPLAFLSPLPGRIPTLWLLNRAARAEGLKQGDSMDSAQRSVRSLRVLDPQPQTWWEAQGAYQRVLEHWSPQGRLVRMGEALVELRGMERLFGPPKDAATSLSRELKAAFGWQSQGGLSRSATAATMASRTETSLEIVADGSESAFLAPRPLSTLPDLAVRPLSRLRRLGLRTLGDLQPLPCHTLSELMPERAALELLQRARGEDRPKLPLFAEPPGSSRHPWRLEPPCLPEEIPLASWALHRLWSEPRSPRSLSLRWWDLDGEPHFWRLAEDLLMEPPLAMARMLETGFHERSTRRLLVRQLELRIQWGLGQAVPLFQENRTLKLQHMESALAKLRKRYPAHAVRPGWMAAEFPKSHAASP